MTISNIKQKLYNYCLSHVDSKATQLQNSINDAQQSLSAETKSTAGDKHDTSRAMMHLEIEKKSQQLVEIGKLKRVMTQFNAEKSNSEIDLGALIKTNKGNYYIAISAGKFTIDDDEYFLISLASPLAQAFKKQFKQDSFQFLNQTFTISSIH